MAGLADLVCRSWNNFKQQQKAWSSFLMLCMYSTLGAFAAVARKQEQIIKYDPQSFLWCCYVTVDFTIAASQNSVCITRQMCHIMINCLTTTLDKRLVIKKIYYAFSYFLKILGFHEGKAFKYWNRSVMQLSQIHCYVSVISTLFLHGVMICIRTVHTE